MYERKLGFLARSIRGLEWLSAAEIRARLGAEITGVGHREVHFELPNIHSGLAELSTVDDVFLNCGQIDDIDHRRTSLHSLAEKAEKLEFAKTLAEVEKTRLIWYPKRFGVVASFLGRRNYNRFEIETALGGVIANQCNAVMQTLTARDNTDVSWRIHLQGHQAYVGLRLFSKPLHRRTYKSVSRTGTLYPPIASAMALLVGLWSDTRFLDPFCGVGTIGIEAAKLNSMIQPIASDIDSSVILLAQGNAKLANVPIHFLAADAGKLPFDYRSLDRIACNIPWGQTVECKGTLSSSTMPFWQEAGRILHSGGRAVFLSEAVEPTDNQLREAKLYLVLRTRIRIRGRWAYLSVCVPDSQRNPTPIDEYGKFGEALLKQWDSYDDTVNQSATRTV